jgi:nucleoside-diphosphate-sugar epimerase
LRVPFHFSAAYGLDTAKEREMSGEIGVFGYGPVGAATVERLAAAGRAVVVAQRQAPASLPAGVSFRRCDALDAASVRAAVAGMSQVVLAIGFPYVGVLWREVWPRTMTNFVEACASEGARLVFFDNLYMYGPQTAPLSETTPLQPVGLKPAARVAATRVWMAASEAGRLRVAALRAPDFYGPGVIQAHLGDTAFGALARGGRAQLIGSPDTPHDFAYVPDCARAVVSLLDAPDDAFGQAWHVPSAPTRTPRQILALGAAAIGAAPRAIGLPPALLGPLGLFVPPLRELAEMRFQWDRPYLVDSSRFAKRFWADATPFEVGAPATALWFRDQAAKR